MIGKTLQNGKYRIERVLGQGGFGITYEGVQTGLGRKVAIKEFFMKDFCEREEGTSHVTIVGTEGNRTLVERFKEKFIKEAQMIAGLEDVPHVIRIYDIFQENGTAYYVMQFIEGGSLDSKVKNGGALKENVAIEYITQIADALGQLHAQRIMHLDIKPANVMLRGNDLYLIDFGVSKHYDAEGDATTTTPVGRSKGYAPIEQYRQGGVQSFSPETDIYSLGATAYFLVTGKTPPEATELIIDPIQRPNGISDSMWNVISTSMRPSKNNRPHSIDEFKNLLFKYSTSEVENFTLGNNQKDADVTIIEVASVKSAEKTVLSDKSKNVYDNAIRLLERKNYSDAIPLFIECANNGDANAQYMCGVIFRRGNGVRKNYKEAIRWYEMSAKQGNVNAQYNLGYMYRNGVGVAPNHSEARKWFTLAAKQGHQDAISILKEM